MTLNYDVPIPTVLVSCDCGEEWEEYMIELGTGYDHCYGFDENLAWPKGGHEDDAYVEVDSISGKTRRELYEEAGLDVTDAKGS